jgi:hypothetical protein
MKIKIALLSIVPCLLVSCGGSLKPGPLVSTPPYKAINLNTPATWGDGIVLKKYTFPTGVYRPQSEDQAGFYYQAADSLTVNDSFLTYGATGGLYLNKGQSSPDHMYVLAPFGGALKMQPKNGPLSVKTIK